MRAVAKSLTASLIAALINAVKREKWNAAFRLARKLSRQSVLTHSEMQAIEFLMIQAARFVKLRSRAGEIEQASAVSASLRKFSLELTHYTLSPRLNKTHKLALRELEQLQNQIMYLKQQMTERENTLRRALLKSREIELYMRGGVEHRRSQPTKKAAKFKFESEQIERVPHMEVRPGSVDNFFEVSVFANCTAPDPFSVVETLKFRVPKRVLQFRVKVSFRCSPHFRIEGSDQASLVFWRTRDDSTTAKFIVSLAKLDHPGPRFFAALFHYNRRPSGKITSFVEYDAATRRISWTEPPSPETTKTVNDKLPNDVPTSRLYIDFRARPSDIRIEVLKTPADDGRTFELRCYTPAGDWKGPWILPEESEKFVKIQMANFVSTQGEQSLATLQGAGIQFWNSVTKEARDLLKRAFKYQVTTISVLSEEPFVPWELMIPVDVGHAPDPCLGVSYSIGRWITGDFRSPEQLIPMRSAFIVAPEKSGLALAHKEAAFLKKKLPGSTQIRPVSFNKLNSGLKSSKHGVVHFICHGDATGTPILKLDPEDVVSSTQVIALAGFLAAFKRHPFTFLNSCEVGQAVRTLAGLGGFPNAFLRMGASAVVAPLWSVDDRVAEKVCKRFYEQVLAGKTFGEAMKSVRAQAFHSGIDTFASYCYYGDPRATVSRKSLKR